MKLVLILSIHSWLVMILVNLTPFVPRSKFGSVAKPELVIWSGGEIRRGGEAPSPYYTPLQPYLSLVFGKCLSLERGRGKVSRTPARIEKKR